MSKVVRACPFPRSRQLTAGILASLMAQASTQIHVPAPHLPSISSPFESQDVVMRVPENKFSLILTLAGVSNGILEVTLSWVLPVWVKHMASAVGVSPSTRHLPSDPPRLTSGEPGAALRGPFHDLVTSRLGDVGFYGRINSVQPFGAHELCLPGPAHSCLLHHPRDSSSHDASRLRLSGNLCAPRPCLLHFDSFLLFFGKTFPFLTKAIPA